VGRLKITITPRYLEVLIYDLAIVNDQGCRVIRDEINLDTGVVGQSVGTSGVVSEPDIMKLCRLISRPMYAELPVKGIHLDRYVGR